MKKLVPIAIVVIAVGAGVALALLWPTDPSSNDVAENAGNESKSFRPTPVDKKDLVRREFDPNQFKPDPIQEFTPPEVNEQSGIVRMVVRGRVVDANGGGVSDARVDFIGAGVARGMNGTAFSRADGSYRLLAWRDSGGNLSTGAKASLLVTTSDGRRTLSDQYEIEDATDAVLPDVVLEIGRTIEGRVVTSDGTPAEGARVEIRSSGAHRAINYDIRRGATTTHKQTVRVVWTDDRGVFRADGLAAAKYRLTCRSTYYGINTNAQIADLETGPTAWLELMLRAENYIRGRLLDMTGEPVPNAVVKAEPHKSNKTSKPKKAAGNVFEVNGTRTGLADNPRRFGEQNPLLAIGGNKCVTDDEGRFGFFNLSANVVYDLVANLGGVETRLNEQSVGMDEREIRVEVKTLIGGRVTDAETGAAINRFDVRVVRGEATVRRFATVNRNLDFPWHTDGRYRFVNSESGTLSVRVSSPNHVPFVTTFDLGAGELRPNVDVVLTPLCDLTLELVLDGQLLDLEPVMLVVEGKVPYKGSTDDLGRAYISRVAPGDYSARVIRSDGSVLVAGFSVPERAAATVRVSLSP